MLKTFIISMTKLLDADWLRRVQFKLSLKSPFRGVVNKVL